MPFDFVDFDVKLGQAAEVLSRPAAVRSLQFCNSENRPRNVLVECGGDRWCPR